MLCARGRIQWSAPMARCGGYRWTREQQKKADGSREPEPEDWITGYGKGSEAKSGEDSGCLGLFYGEERAYM